MKIEDLKIGMPVMWNGEKFEDWENKDTILTSETILDTISAILETRQLKNE